MAPGSWRSYRRLNCPASFLMSGMVRTTGIDYQRITLQERYDDALAKFLLSRMPKRRARS